MSNFILTSAKDVAKNLTQPGDEPFEPDTGDFGGNAHRGTR